MQKICSLQERTAFNPRPLASLATASLAFSLSIPVHLHIPLPSHAMEDCRGSPACISTSAYQSPSQYMAPWIVTGQASNAFQHLKEQLLSDVAEMISDHEKEGHIEALLSGDKLSFEIRDKMILFRSVKVGGRELTPPFCLVPHCITGPSNRVRLESLRDRLGYINLETDEDKVWNQIFLH